MKESLRQGVAGSASYPVTEEMSPPHLPAKVLSTPSMIQLIEQTCLVTAQEHLDDGESSVGTHVDVSHTGPAFPGEEVTVDVTLVAIRKRRLEFEVEVRSPRGVISAGRHERAVIDLERFAGG